MAFSIHIKKISEDGKFVYYAYGSTNMKFGHIKIEKANGNTFLIELAEGDEGAQAKRAGWALMKHWKEGEYPEETHWAS